MEGVLYTLSHFWDLAGIWDMPQRRSLTRAAGLMRLVIGKKTDVVRNMPESEGLG